MLLFLFVEFGQRALVLLHPQREVRGEGLGAQLRVVLAGDFPAHGEDVAGIRRVGSQRAGLHVPPGEASVPAPDEGPEPSDFTGKGLVECGLGGMALIAPQVEPVAADRILASNLSSWGSLLLSRLGGN